MTAVSGPLAVVKSLDHLVLTCASVTATDWYVKYLGMKEETFTSPLDPWTPRTALKFGNQEINLHQQGKEFEPKAKTALPGTADLCILVEDSMDLNGVIKGFQRDGIKVLEGEKLTQMAGTQGPIRSVYVRDPDGTLVVGCKIPTPWVGF